MEPAQEETQNYPKHPPGGREAAPKWYFAKFGLSKLFQMVSIWYHLKQFETFWNVSKLFKICFMPFLYAFAPA